MKQQIRFGAFETNSSSTHSLTTGTSKLVAQPFDKAILRSGVVTAHPGDYGWEYYRYHTARGKLDYLVSQLIGNGRRIPGGEDRAAVFAELAEATPRLRMLAKVVKDYTGCTLELASGTPSIDHDSVGVGYEVYESEATLKQFLFDETAYVQTGNNNSPPPFMMSSDKGLQYTYTDRVCETVPKSYVAVTLRALTEHPFSPGFATLTGGLVMDEDELFKRLTRKLIVSMAVVTEYANHRYADEGGETGQVADSLFDQTDKFPGLKALSTFKAAATFHKVKTFAECRKVVQLHCFLPASLAVELGALTAGGVSKLELAQSRRMLKHWQKLLERALAEGKDISQTRWEREQISGHEALVNQLQEERRIAKQLVRKSDVKASAQKTSVAERP